MTGVSVEHVLTGLPGASAEVTEGPGRVPTCQREGPSGFWPDSATLVPAPRHVEGSRVFDGYFRTPARRPATFAPPVLPTNCVRTGIALATSSGLRPSFEKALAALASPGADPATC